MLTLLTRHNWACLQALQHTWMLRKLGPVGGLVPSRATWPPPPPLAPAPQAGGLLPEALPGVPTSMGALLRTNWLSGMRAEELRALSMGDSSSGSVFMLADLLIDRLRVDDMLVFACAQSQSSSLLARGQSGQQQSSTLNSEEDTGDMHFWNFVGTS